MVLISRTDLIEILGSAAGEADIRMGTTIAKLDDSDECVVSVELSDGSTEDFDLLIACDGIHSPTRQAVFGGEPDVFDTDWILWAWWAPMPD
jgi:2-polyprenyl-6-methoxyphenol hydroxylase-like FAD-dependent oxidoreductase